MGWCHEFGAQVREGCDHPMQAGVGACSCAVCGTACNGRFAGCDLVWARGPRPVVRVRPAGTRSGNGREATATPAPPPTDQPNRPGQPGHPGHPDDLARLLAAVDDLRHDVAALAATFASRSEALDQSSTRLVELVEDLPLRIGAAVRTALQADAGNGAPVPGGGDVPAPVPEPAAPAPTVTSADSPAGTRRDWDALRSRLAALTREPPAAG